MKTIIIHNDFRAYFPPRLLALQEVLTNRGDELYIIELFEESIDYGFTTEDKSVFHHHEFLFNTYKGISMLHIKKKLMKRLDEINPDVVLCWAIAYPAGAIPVKWANFRKKPVISMDDAQKDTFPRSKFNHFIKKHIFKHVDAFMCPSERWDETMLYWGFKKEQIFYGISVVDNEFWSDNTNNNNNIELKDFILTVGRQIPVKRHIDLLNAYKIYATKMGEEAKDLVLIGDGIERKKLEDFVSINKLKGVRFIPFLSPVELRNYYHNASLFALTSVSETFGLVVNEAMNGACPILVTDNVGCATTLVKHNINGYIVETGNIKAIADALVKFHNMSIEELNSASNESKNIISNWGLPKFTSNVCNAVDYVINKPRPKLSLFDRIILYLWNGRIKITTNRLS